ncbi:RsmE family RNA methyltransferase, partial [Clostridium perfringens]
GGVFQSSVLNALYRNCAAYLHGHEVGGTNPSLLRAMHHGAPCVPIDVVFHRENLGPDNPYFAKTPGHLAALLRDWAAGRALFFADETGGVPAFDAMRTHRGPAAILIGPEGGFTDEERTAIRAHPDAVGIGLGPRILRADTAAAAAVSVWMAAAGDWSETA